MFTYANIVADDMQRLACSKSSHPSNEEYAVEKSVPMRQTNCSSWFVNGLACTNSEGVGGKWLTAELRSGTVGGSILQGRIFFPRDVPAVVHLRHQAIDRV